ncbi:MAG TPA: hypothetical protein VEV16_04005 [Daejeonella sp.]|nr:hypothetical protein [Daejeonella sp.]
MKIVNIFPNQRKITGLCLFVLLLIGFNSTWAQNLPPIPANYKLESPADFKAYETEVIQCIYWLAETPRNTHPEMRQKTEDFLVQWIYGSPYVNVIIEPYIMKLSSKNADLLLSFIFGYSLYQLEHPGDKNLLPANVAGLTNLLNDYQKNLKVLKKDPLIDKVIGLQASGKLSDWILPQLGQKTLN